MLKIVHRLKEKWSIENNKDFILIMLVFSIAGMLIGFERRPIFHVLGITTQTPLWIKVCVYIPLIPPIYQVNLLVFGFLLGQFEFFWEKEKKILKFFGKIFSLRSSS